MVRRTSKKRTKMIEVADIILNILYFGLFVFIVLAGISKDIDILNKNRLVAECIRKIPDFIFDHPSGIVHLLTTICVLAGVFAMVSFLWRRFKISEYLELPWIGKYLQGNWRIKNRFYDPFYKTTAKAMRERIIKLEESAKTSQKEKAAFVAENQKLASDISLDRKEIKRLKGEYERLICENAELVQQNAKLKDDCKLSWDLLYDFDQTVQHLRELHDLMRDITYGIENPELVRNDPNKIFNKFAYSINKVTRGSSESKCSAVLLLDPVANQFKVVGSYGIDSEYINTSYPSSNAFIDEIRETKQAIVRTDLSPGEFRVYKPLCLENYNGIIGVPITNCRDQVIGILVVRIREKNVFRNGEDDALLSYFTRLLAIYIPEFEKGQSINIGKVITT